MFYSVYDIIILMWKSEKKILPKVSIVIPVYNGAKYIRFAIESALAQTYKNIEIIVVDDGSTDNTEEIVRSYGAKVSYIKKKNGGVSSALNLGIKQMTGEYFSWLSHDDTYEPNKIEREMDYLIENNYVRKKIIVFSDYYLINTKGKIIGESRKDCKEIAEKPEYIFLKGHINGLSLLIPKKAFETYGGFDTQLICTQDYVKWYEMSKTYKFVHIPELLVSTRWHAKQVTNSNPLVTKEGNDFYFKLIDDVKKKRREELEGSEYCFFLELAKFYNNSVYTEVGKYCEKKAKEILEKTNEEGSKKKVSVVIPFYNRREEVMRAIKSVLAQTHENYEIILIDDGSTDDISEIESLARNSNGKIKLFRNRKNVGASQSRNKGILESSGDYIAFLDSDDEFMEKKLEIQLRYMIASKARFSHTSYERFWRGERTIINSGKDDGHCERKLIYNCPIATPTVMFDAEWVKNNKIQFSEKLEIGEDTCLWLEILKRGVYLVGIDEALTRVNVGDKAAAYDDDKQIIGLKAIIKYLLNDDYYSAFDYEVSRLMKAYVSYVEKTIPEQEPLVTGGPLKKLVFYAKTEGIRSATKRTIKKISEVLGDK